MTEQHAVDSDSLTEASFEGDVLAEPGEVIDIVDGVEVRNVFDDSPRVPAVEPTPGADFREDFPEGAG